MRFIRELKKTRIVDAEYGRKVVVVPDMDNSQKIRNTGLHTGILMPIRMEISQIMTL